jgi:hypothetical protein
MKRKTIRTWNWSILFLAVLLLPFFLSAQSLRINEFMSDNDNTITDGDGDYSDWIEIYNTSAVDVILTGWTLSDDSTNLQKWFLPADTLAANSYILIFASGKDSITENEFHTNFKLSSAGEYLALSAPDSSIISEFKPAYPEQERDVSYSYFTGSYYNTITPTPGSANIITENPTVVAPVFNFPHGFYNNSFYLKMTTDGLTKDIYYTTDGSEPSPTNGTLYSDSIEISTTSIIRAVAVLNDSLSKVTTATYLFFEDVINQPNDPPGYPDMWGPYHAIAGTAIADYEMDPEITQDAQWANVMDDALRSLPTMSIVTKKGNLFSHTIDPDTGGIYIYTGDADDDPDRQPGLGWERPASVEYFTVDGLKSFQVDCGLRIHGGHSRRPEKEPKHSFRLVFRSIYGQSRLNFPLFDSGSTETFNTLVLRAGFGNEMTHHSHIERIKTQYIRDQWTKQTQLDMGQPAGHGGYVHLYLNGIYWGIYNPTERLDKDFAQTYYGGEEDNFDIIKDYTEVVEGNLDAWNAMKSIANAGLAEDANYQRIQGNNPDGTRNPDYPVYLDMVNFIDYMVVNYFGANSDWDHHNWAAIRDRTNPDKGFQFFSWDSEHMVKQINDNNLDRNNDGKPSGLFNLLAQNEKFKKLFADRVQLFFFNGGVLTPEKNTERWMKFANQLEPAIIAEVARWGDYRRDVHQFQTAGPFDLYGKQYWTDELNFMINDYFPQRGDVFINQLKAAGLFPNTVAPSFLINGEEPIENIISSGDILSMVTNTGDIYYTTNGSDVIVTNSGDQLESYTLISPDKDKRVYIPEGNISNTWYSDLDFDDSAWLLAQNAPGGIGYENGSGYESMISLDVGEQMTNNTSCYIRLKFNTDEETLNNLTTLYLNVLYDDGFAAYLNGTKVTEMNAPATLSWNSTATGGHEASNFVSFNITSFINLLSEGESLLALHALNASITSSDFIINAELIGSNALADGELSPDAVLYESPLILSHGTHIKARTFSGGEWSALSDKLFVLPADIMDLTISEIHYHPSVEDTSEDGRLYEFIELKNKDNASLDLSGVHFSNGISYQFPVHSILNPNAYIVLASNTEKFTERYGFAPFDTYEGYLDNSGERIVLLSASSDTILNIRYNDKSPWPEAADGDGFSMVNINPDSSLDLNDGSNWRASHYINGSPGKADVLMSDIDKHSLEKPDKYYLLQNYPNPFNPKTVISWQLPANSHVNLSIYNILGQKVVTLINEKRGVGTHRVEWNAKNFTSGVYFYRIIAGDFVKTKRMLLIK